MILDNFSVFLPTSLCLILTILSYGSVLTSAQLPNPISEEDKTRLIEEFRSSQYNTTNSPRTELTENAEEFQNEWRSFAPAIAPLLGIWQSSIEERANIAIYPSLTDPMQACVLTYGTVDRFGIGNIVGVGYSARREITIVESETMRDGIFLRDGDFLLWLYVYTDGSPEYLPYNSLSPLVDPEELISDDLWSRVRSRFNAVGCTVSLPPDQEVPLRQLRNRDLTGESSNSNVIVRFDNAYVTNSGVEAYVDIENNSNEDVTLATFLVRVEDAEGNRLEGCRFFRLPGAEIAEANGGTMHGRLVMSHSWEEVSNQELFLVIPLGSMTGERSFRVPMQFQP